MFYDKVDDNDKYFKILDTEYEYSAKMFYDKVDDNDKYFKILGMRYQLKSYIIAEMENGTFVPKMRTFTTKINMYRI